MSGSLSGPSYCYVVPLPIEAVTDTIPGHRFLKLGLSTALVFLLT